MTEEERQLALEHKEVLEDIRAVVATLSGRRLFKYLMKVYKITDLPPEGIEGRELFEALGFLRSGRAIFELINQANAQVASELLTTIEKERYAKELLENAPSTNNG